MRKCFYYLFLFVASILLGCNKNSGTEGIPSYVKVEKIHLLDNPNPNTEEGSLSEDINDVWVRTSNQDVGGFEMPALIPILEEGETNLRMSAGIFMNGISTTRVAYPFYEPFDTVVNLVAGEVISVSPKVKYKDNIELLINETFDFTNTTFTKSSLSAAEYTQTFDEDESFEGAGSVKIVLNKDEKNLRIEGVEDYDLPIDGRDMFIELNYKTDVNILLSGFFTDDNGLVVEMGMVGVRPTDEWKKVYVNFTSVMFDNPNIVSFKPIISAAMPDDYAGDEAVVMFDNYKFIYLQ